MSNYIFSSDGRTKESEQWPLGFSLGWIILLWRIADRHECVYTVSSVLCKYDVQLEPEKEYWSPELKTAGKEHMSSKQKTAAAKESGGGRETNLKSS